jgi:hypothetical protein
MLLARNTVSGQIADVSPKMLRHPAFKDVLEVVEPGSKPYLPEMYLSGTKQERSLFGAKKKDATEQVADNETIIEEDK